MLLSFYARINSFKINVHINTVNLRLNQFLIRNIEFTTLATRTPPVGQMQYVIFTSEVASVNRDTLPGFHPSQFGMFHNDDFSWTTGGAEGVTAADVFCICRRERVSERVSSTLSVRRKDTPYSSVLSFYHTQ